MIHEIRWHISLVSKKPLITSGFSYTVALQAGVVSMCFLLHARGGVGAVTKYSDEYVCVCVCLSVREDISGTTRAILTNFCACCLWPWLGLPPAGWRYTKGRGNFGDFLPHWQA